MENGIVIAGVQRVSAGISSIANSTAVHDAWRTAPARASHGDECCGHEHGGHGRPDGRVGEHAEECTAHFCFLTFRASRSISRREITFSSTIPTRNCSTEPAQKRSMMWRTARAATPVAGMSAR